MSPPKVTRPEEPLNDPKWEKFARLLAVGTVTYLKAYEEIGRKPEKANAKRLARHPLVKARIAFLKNSVADKVIDGIAGKAVAQLKDDFADRAWVRRQLIQNAMVCMGELPVKKKRIIATGRGKNRKEREFVVDELVHMPSAANKALELLGQDIGMFQAQNLPPPPAELFKARSVEDPRILAILDRYRERQTTVFLAAEQPAE